MGLKFTSNSTARFSSTASIDWANVTGKPIEIAGFGNLNSTGLVAATDLTGDFVGRTITGTAAEITVTNGDGVAANPTLSLPAALTFTGKTITGGTYTGAVSFNGNIWTAGTGTLTLGAGKTATISNTLTFTGTDTSSVAFGTGGTVAYQGGTLAQFAATTSAQLLGVISDETGTGALVFANTPTLVTPVLGVATATTINKVTITAPASAATLTVIDGTTLTGPAASGTLMSKTSTDIMTNKTFDSAGTGNSLSVSGVAVSRGQYPGSNTNDNATAGNSSEYISSTIAQASAVALTTTAIANLTTITLTPGDWDVNFTTTYVGAATTTVAFVENSMSTTSATQDRTDTRVGSIFYNSLTIFGTLVGAPVPCGPARFSISTTTTVFAVMRANFAVSTCSAYGTIRARRMR